MSRDNLRSQIIYISPPTDQDLRIDSEAEAELLSFPDTVRLLPMWNHNCYPMLVTNISIEEPRAIEYVCGDEEVPVLGLFPLKNREADVYNLKKEDFYPIGVVAKVIRVEERESETDPLKVAALGVKRVRMDDLYPEGPMVKISPIDEGEAFDESLMPLLAEAKRLFAETLMLTPGATPVNLYKLNLAMERQPSVVADLFMCSLPLNATVKAEYLAIENLKMRFHRLLEILTMEVANRKAGRAISARIENSMATRQKEMHLREQLKAIKEELGEGDDNDDLADLKKLLAEAELPEAARSEADRDLRRLKQTPASSAEYSHLRTYLECLADLPWNKSSQGETDLGKAREILDRDHLGLEKVKKRILEFLAVHKLTGNLKAPILCLTGPPGVGKTSLGRSLAEAMGREFYRISLGGLRDEAEIRGHRRTYVGANPGKIITGLRKVGVNNPVFLLDEIDKMGQSHQGDPASALLEALDPEQNDTFTDNYLDLPFDLSNVTFVLTANVVENIPGPLRDRLEIIEVTGYSVDEKIDIAKRHLWAKELGRAGLKAEEATIGAREIQDLIVGYTWEAGCRDLSRKLGALARDRAMAKAEGLERPLEVSASEIGDILGPPTRRPEDKREKEPRIGVVTGLAWTAGGGDIMFVEAVAMPGKGNLSLTGQLGDVMKESAQAALCHVRSRARDWFLRDGWFKENDVHIHLPHGAIPKDGPSAGVSLATAIVSLISGQKVRPDVAMTGEITLRGLVLPIGGVKEKLLAAKRAGLTTVLIPEGNLTEVQQLSPSVTQGLNVVAVATMDDVLERALMVPEGALECEAINALPIDDLGFAAWTAALKFREANLATKILPMDDTGRLNTCASQLSVA
ncbi:MAG: endopeptidase La [Deltaproteobacteria bacterium]|jgi:ATP-dependent Lon protease|nr:endopeptidase La [Deltaproteobacteria bacterium]